MVLASYGEVEMGAAKDGSFLFDSGLYPRVYADRGGNAGAPNTGYVVYGGKRGYGDV